MDVSFSVPSIISAVFQPIKMTLQNKFLMIGLIFFGLFSASGVWYWNSTADEREAQKYVDEFIQLGINLNEEPNCEDKQEMEKYNKGRNMLEEVRVLAKHMKNGRKYSDFVESSAPLVNFSCSFQERLRSKQTS